MYRLLGYEEINWSTICELLDATASEYRCLSDSLETDPPLVCIQPIVASGRRPNDTLNKRALVSWRWTISFSDISAPPRAESDYEIELPNSAQKVTHVRLAGNSFASGAALSDFAIASVSGRSGAVKRGSKP
jgi:hypothetical protein